MFDKLYAAKIYGTIKSHEKGAPIRPIVSDRANLIRHAQRAIKEILNVFISRDDFPFIIGNTEQVVRGCKTLGDKIHRTHKLRTVNYESMYTNVNLDDFCGIIWGKYDSFCIEHIYGIGKDELIEMMKLMFGNFSYIS